MKQCNCSKFKICCNHKSTRFIIKLKNYYAQKKDIFFVQQPSQCERRDGKYLHSYSLTFYSLIHKHKNFLKFTEINAYTQNQFTKNY